MHIDKNVNVLILRLNVVAELYIFVMLSPWQSGWAIGKLSSTCVFPYPLPIQYMSLKISQ